MSVIRYARRMKERTTWRQLSRDLRQREQAARLRAGPSEQLPSEQLLADIASEGA
jgi:Arc/MetJ-type ribon-helix-helix transcriptional regulator